MKTAYLLINCWLLLTAATVCSQYSLSGRITDKADGEALPGVSVYLTDLRTGSLTDRQGEYRFESLRPGSYLIELETPGFKSIVRRIELSSDTQLDFEMEEAVTELDNVVITGVSRSTELKRNPVIIKTIGKEEMNRNIATNLIDALKTVPGINEITTGPGISKPIIRGLGFNRVLTLKNGIRQEGQQWGGEHGVEIDEYSVDRAEIIKGPGSLMYGSDGIAGVLNFLPPKPPAEGTTETELVTNYQTNNGLIGTSVSNSGNRNGFRWSGRISNKLAGNFSNRYDGKVLNSGYRELNGELSLGLGKSWGHSLLTLSGYNSKLGIAEGERDESGNFVFENSNGDEVTATASDLNGYRIGVPYQRVGHYSISSNSYFILDKGSISADLGFQNNRRREYEEAESPDTEGLSLSLNTFSYNFRYNFKNTGGWYFSAGISGMQQTNRNRGMEFLIPDYNLFDIGSFVFGQKNFGQLTLAGGFRFDNRHMNTRQLYLNRDEEPVSDPDSDSELKFSHFVRDYSGFSGSLGLSWQPSGQSVLKLNFSQGFRAPNISELSSNGKHEGTFRYEIGNPDLKSEISRQIDLGYYLNSDHITLEISPFANFISHYIYLEKWKDAAGNDIIPDPSDPAPAFGYTSGNAVLTGGEVYLDIHPHPLDWLHLENSFSYVRATRNHSADSTKYLPSIPAPHYRGGIKVEMKNLGRKIKNLYLKLGVDHYFAQNNIYSAFDTETGTPAYTLLSAGAGADFSLLGIKDFISLFLSASNLTDTAYQSHLSRLKYAAPNPYTGRRGIFDQGRNFSIRLVMRF